MHTHHSTHITMHTYTQAMRELEWRPEYGLVDGLRDSYVKDFGRGTFRKEADFSVDDMILEKVKGRSYAPASTW